MEVRWAAASAPGTCGELVQGTLRGEPFLVSCPISWRALARVVVRPDRGLSVSGPRDRWKSLQAVRAALRLLDVEGVRVELSLFSPLPVGKGMGSSTAELLAAAAATAAACGRPLTPWELARLACSVEPSNGTMFPGLVRFDHLGASRTLPLGDPPSLEVAIFDLGGQVDTLAFNARPDLEGLNAAKAAQVAEALAELERGVAAGDPLRVGRAATQSALAHQAILPKPALERLLEAAVLEGCVGLVVAHSGTVVGCLAPALSPSRLGRLRRRVAKAEPAAVYLGRGRVQGGGVHLFQTGAGDPVSRPRRRPPRSLPPVRTAR